MPAASLTRGLVQPQLPTGVGISIPMLARGDEATAGYGALGYIIKQP